jgi:hypothetical protein
MSGLKAFTGNRKTVLSVDFDRFTTCPQICEYCYVGTTERLYPAYASKIKRNADWAVTHPKQFSTQLNTEYKKLRHSKSKKFYRLDKLPARIYGSGDFIPEHFEFLKQLDFKFYVISKSLTSKNLLGYLDVLLTLPNLTKIILSLDNQNIFNWSLIKQYYKKDKFGISYTGTVDDFKNHKSNGIKTTIFFNISKKKSEKLRVQKLKEQCPCDSGLLESTNACSICNKCWRSSATKDKAWNVLN